MSSSNNKNKLRCLLTKKLNDNGKKNKKFGNRKNELE